MQGCKESASAHKHESPAEGDECERVLGQYLRQEITREEAIQAVGLEKVELAEREHAAMLEDLAWAVHTD